MAAYPGAFDAPPDGLDFPFDDQLSALTRATSEEGNRHWEGVAEACQAAGR